jgi:transketolase
LSLRPQFAETITTLAEKDLRVVMIVGDISHGIFGQMRLRSPSRYFNIGICEPSMVSVAAGLSAQGLIPVVHTIAPFLIERSYEQIKLGFSYQNLGANLVSVGGSFEYSKLGCTHHCYSDYSLISKLPNSQIFFPGSAEEFNDLFLENYDNGKLNYFRLTEFPHKVEFTAQISSARAVKVFAGTDLTVIACGGPSLKRAKEACDLLIQQNYSPELLYFHTLKPFDSALAVESISRTRTFLVVEENHSSDGIMSLILRAINGKFPYRSHHIAVEDFIRNYGTYEHLIDSARLNVNTIVSYAKDLLT